MKKIRPTSGKVRQALFNILYDVSGTRFLDLFAGTGEIGITALKKGADFVVFVEKDRKRAEDIKKKASKYSQNFKVVAADAVRFLRNYKKEPFDVIFADPPYDYKDYDKVIQFAFEKLGDGGVFILEHRNDKHFDAEEEREYGDTILSFWRK
ncbi:RsmD family RNA methyltransferase [Persephonella sp.]